MKIAAHIFIGALNHALGKWQSCVKNNEWVQKIKPLLIFSLSNTGLFPSRSRCSLDQCFPSFSNSWLHLQNSEVLMAHTQPHNNTEAKCVPSEWLNIQGWSENRGNSFSVFHLTKVHFSRQSVSPISLLLMNSLFRYLRFCYGWYDFKHTIRMTKLTSIKYG